jgi:hypothetical protein
MPSGVSFSPSRRVLLAGGAAAGLGGALVACSGADGGGDEPADDTGLRRRAARDSAALLARYEATARAHPALEATLVPFREVVTEHVAALAEDGRGAGSGGGAAPGVPGEQDAALGALIDAERETARRRYGALDEAPPELARLLASMAAAGSAQAYLLSEART